MPDVFQLDQRDLKLLTKFFKKAPKKAAKASASVMNRMSFVTRQTILQQLPKLMKIRNTRFMTRQIKFTKAKVGPISTQFSEVGSVFATNFSGWREQELGTPTDRTRTQTVLARGGSFGGKVKNANRMKPSNQFDNARDIYGTKPKTDSHRLFVLFTILIRKKLKTSFIIPTKLKGFTPGLYKKKGKKIIKLQNLKPDQVQPKRIRWMTSSLNILKRSINLKQEWGKALERSMKFK